MATLYTIIIPHFDLPDLLEACLKSIPDRDDIQIIVVDDFSSQENILKLKELEFQFKNVLFVFQTENGGGGHARNTGLSLAKGKYILFADADDFFTENFISVLDTSVHDDSDIIYFNANFIYENQNEENKQVNHVQKILKCYKKNKSKGEFLLRYSFGEPWCKLIRRNLIEKYHIRFEETKIHNDTKFSYLVGFYAKKIKVVETPVYNYLVRSQSVSKTISEDRLLTRTKIFAEKYQFLKKHKIPFFDNLLLVSFRYAKKTKNEELYEKCLAITKNYGIKDSFIAWQLFKSKVRSFIKRNCKRLKKHLFCNKIF